MPKPDEEIDRLISKRASQDRRPDPDEQHELWKTSARAHNARHQEAMRAAWCEYHRSQAERLKRTVEPLIAFHETRVKALISREPNGTERKGH